MAHHAIITGEMASSATRERQANHRGGDHLQTIRQGHAFAHQPIPGS
jgi:hypothetical protein